jgi:4-amino-4-deoxy-L-arabinose transferase-like glycosyltransferase
MEKILTKRNILLTIVLFVFSVSLSTFFIKIIPPLPVISDSKDYHDIAVGIVSKLDYVTISSDLILYPPFYPVFLSIIYTITDVGSFAAVYLIQYILVFGISVLVFKILRKYSQMSFKLTLSMSCVILFWPYFILYSQLISSEILYSFLLLFSFFLFLNIDNYSKKWLTFCTGIFIGLTILTRPVALLLLPWVFLGLVLIG